MNHRIKLRTSKIMMSAILVLCSWAAFGEDYAVTLKNDTLRGKVSIQAYGIIDHIQITSSEKKRTNLTAIQVKAVSIAGETYQPVRTDNGYRMMKLVRQGFVSVYLGRKASTVSGQSYYYDTEYLVKKDGNSIEVPNLSFKKVIKNFLSECEAMKAKIDKEDLGRKDLDKILDEYNICINDQTKIANAQSSVAKEDPRIVAITNLRAKIEASSLSTKQDALDITNDILDKALHNQTVPNYQLEGLKNLLKGSDELSSDLQQLLATINTH
jgi:hypothetical protein